jgi:site-specific recombinase XerD
MPERLPRPLTPTQVDGFFSRIESLRDRALFSLLYRSGLRVGEALALNIEDMNSAEGTLRVIGKGNRERVGYLSAETARLIRRMLRERGRAQSGPLFASRQGRLSYAMAHRLFSQYASGLSETESLTIHQLRHSFGSERAGHIDALLLRDLMGHQSLRTTQQYAKVNPEAAHAAFRAFDKHKSRG